MSLEEPMSGDCIIEAGTVLCGVLPDGTMSMRHDVGIRVAGGMIAQIGPLAAVAYGNDHLARFGSPDMIAMPGLVNSHHHFGITPLMQGVPFAPLEFWLPQFRAMRQIDVRLDTLYSAIEMLESGTTMVQHINSGLAGAPENWMATANATLEAYIEIGMRAGFSFMIRDRNILTYDEDAKVLATLPDTVRSWIAPKLHASNIPIADLMTFYRALRESWFDARPDHVRINLAPANLHWCTDECLHTIFETARETDAQVHMHLLETERQSNFAHNKFGHSAVQHLKALECLGPNVTLGHGNWMSRADLDIVADCGCSMCHNASSGLRLGSGIAPVNEMRRRDIPVALGIDQSNIADDRDMTLEMKLVWALHRETGLWNDRPDAGAVLQMATEHGARTVGFGGFTGRLEPGHQADIVLMDRRKIGRPHVNVRTPVVESLLHRGGRHAITQVFVGGRLVVNDGKVITIDREAVLSEIRERLECPETQGERQALDAIASLLPHLEAYHRNFTPAAGYRPYRYNAMADEEYVLPNRK
ncbi:amidohydrolase family protein [Rhizobium leguminosarum]|uniref:amidohydrolase family protein n=1 Tax=Rhizobium leguminosarum TaxID=384 RepID=UPI000480F4A9|nr:amidohydrolase family protein [Rhizobium leguminosarum]